MRNYGGLGLLGDSHGYTRAALEASSDGAITYNDVPWIASEEASSDDLSQVVLVGVGKEDTKKALRAEVLRWHPDKFLQKLGSRLPESERERILQRVNQVSSMLHDLYRKI
ncbi:hypothetical protein CYMTET_12344 [Cymbomonas tetramitiformis]|uniref:J domain-containing protein n=1 Tax=Cymbomonas tetramitiformis TaxID=36881 RepID=A0AAE0GKR3_9CHLO|nr:hypothetical protein CYMTET_12344 [Cymbomonas tetramitiformis]|eukprot:gene9899-11724_t